jgi:hypothetical protein
LLKERTLSASLDPRNQQEDDTYEQSPVNRIRTRTTLRKDSVTDEEEHDASDEWQKDHRQICSKALTKGPSKRPRAAKTSDAVVEGDENADVQNQVVEDVGAGR